jgi:hypothetical protein
LEKNQKKLKRLKFETFHYFLCCRVMQSIASEINDKFWRSQGY